MHQKIFSEKDIEYIQMMLGEIKDFLDASSALTKKVYYAVTYSDKPQCGHTRELITEEN